MHLERHPLSAEYADLTCDEFNALVDSLKTHGQLFAIVVQDGKVIDGWQRLRACQWLGIEPRIEELPPGTDLESYVRAVNDARRHESAEDRARRVARRRERVVEKREQGKSIRTIADEEQIDPKQVRKDLAAASGGDRSPPEIKKSKGKDGKEYPATKEPDESREPDGVYDDNGVLVPAKLRPIFGDVADFENAYLAADRARKAFEKLEATVAFQRIGSGKKYSSMFRTAAEATRQDRPAVFCCAEGCDKCEQRGFLCVGDVGQ